MKKYSIKLLALLTLVVLLGSCSDFLDTNPTDRLPSDEVPSLRDAEKIVNGFYHSMKWNDYYGTPLMVLGENRGDDLRPTRADGGGYAAIYNYEFTPSNNAYGGVWDKAYNVIMNTNLLLAKWNDIAANTQDEIDRKNIIKGQILTVRAFCHFDIARIYGYPYQKDNGASLGAVIADKVFAIGEQKARSTVKETYDFIIKDLTDALPLFVSAKKKRSHGNFNYWGAKGLLARVYLYMGDYDNAFKHADEILTDSDNPYSLITNANYIESWGKEDSPETMLELLISSVNGLDNNGGVNSWYYIMWHGVGFSAGNLVPTDAWFTLLDEDPNDVRQGFVDWRYPTGTETFAPYKWIAKFPGNNGEQDFKRNHPMIMRLSEIYLIAAEAALKKPTPDQSKADTYLHAIRERANPSTVQLTATEDLVLKERRKELIGEGHRYYDLGRLGYTIDRSAADNKLPANTNYRVVDPWNRAGNQHQVVLPMSQTQRLANPAAQQNPGY